MHNLVRAVAPPFPGAFALADGVPLARAAHASGRRHRARRNAQLRWIDGEVRALCADGALRLLEFELDGQPCDAAGVPRALRCSGRAADWKNRSEQSWPTKS